MLRDEDSQTTATPRSSTAGSVRMYALREQEHFDFNTSPEWPTPRSQFEDFACAAAIDQASDERRIRLLLYAMGPESRLLLAAFKSSAE